MIESLSNKKVKEVIKIGQNRRYRYKENKYLVEGFRMVMEVPQELLDTIYVQEGEDLEIHHMSQGQLDKIEWVSREVLRAMSLEISPQGALAVVKMRSEPSLPIWEEAYESQLVLALDEVQDPGNLGTILRTALAAGVDLVVLGSGTVDLYNPKVVKATMGAVYHLKIVQQIDLKEYIGKIKEAGYQILVTYLEGSHIYHQVPMKEKLCIVMGNEGNGVSSQVLELADQRVLIPMSQASESLNVAVATAILLYEAKRQRY